MPRGIPNKKPDLETEQVEKQSDEITSETVDAPLVEEDSETRSPFFESNQPATIHYIFEPEIRAYEESIQRELTSHIERISAVYAIPLKELSAQISLNYLPNGTWALRGEVIHEPDDKEESI